MENYEFKNEVFKITCKGTAARPDVYALYFKGRQVAKTDYAYAGEREFEVKTKPEKFLDFDASLFPDRHQFLLDLKHPVVCPVTIFRSSKKIRFQYFVGVEHKDLESWDVNPIKVALLFFASAKKAGYEIDDGAIEYFHENLCLTAGKEIPAKGNLLAVHQRQFAQLLQMWQQAYDRVLKNVTGNNKNR